MTSSREERIAALPANLQELLRKRLAGEAAGAVAVDAIPLVSRDEPLDLSAAQQRLWFLYEFEPDNIEYNTPRVLRLRGTLDLAALRRALDGVVARHESLRTVFG